jgi:hypothetical protein
MMRGVPMRGRAGHRGGRGRDHALDNGGLGFDLTLQTGNPRPQDGKVRLVVSMASASAPTQCKAGACGILSRYSLPHPIRARCLPFVFPVACSGSKLALTAPTPPSYSIRRTGA